MHDWVYVGAGYGLTFISVAAYVWSLRRRAARAGKQIRALRGGEGR